MKKSTHHEALNVNDESLNENSGESAKNIESEDREFWMKYRQMADNFFHHLLPDQRRKWNEMNGKDRILIFDFIANLQKESEGK